MTRVADARVLAFLLVAGCFDFASVSSEYSDAGNDEACAGNLIPDPTFEDGAADWGSNDGIITRVADGHGGQGLALKLCKNVATAELAVTSQPASLVDLPVDTTITASVWIRTADDIEDVFSIRINEFDADDVMIAQGSKDEVVVDTSWQRVMTSYTVTQASSSLKIRLASVDAPEGWCLLFDDVCVVREP